MDYVIDFDKMFEEYAMQWFADRKDEYGTDDEVEAAMADVYEQWASSPSHKLGGIAPRAFFDGIENPTELIAILVGTSEGDNNPCSLLLDRITEVGECAPFLRGLIEKATSSSKLKMICMQLLREMGAEHPLKAYLGIIAEESDDDELFEAAVDLLKENVEAVREELYRLAKSDVTPPASKEAIAEILASSGRDERTFALLTELFAAGDNLPLYSQLLGIYGDERAANILYRALDTCSYAEYIEVRNAIERLGGVVDDNFRNFDNDPTYALLKGRNK